MLKYFKRADVYKNSTGTNKVSLTKKEAYSYDWWKYYTLYKGLTIFNNANYSSATNKHQSETLRLLDYKTDLMLYNTSESLGDIEKALQDEVTLLRKNVIELISKIKAPRTRAATNDKRRVEIKQHLGKIYNIRVILTA